MSNFTLELEEKYSSEAIADIAELMAVWNILEGMIKERLPTATKERLYQLTKDAVDWQFKQCAHSLSSPLPKKESL